MSGPAQPDPAPESPRPATELPRDWLWDFGNVRLGYPADGVTQVGVIECWKYDGSSQVTPTSPPHTIRNNQVYKQDQIAERLREPIPLHNGIHPSSGFQVAILPCSNQSLPMLGIPTLDAINEALGLPNHNHHYASVRSGAVGMFVLPDNSWLFARPRAPDFSSISTILRYHPQTNFTRGVFYADFTIAHFKNIVGEFEGCSHPLLLPLLALELTLDANVSHLERSQTTLERVEGSTGYGLLEQKGEETSYQDYRMLVKDLSKARSGYHLALATLHSTQWCAEYILKRIPWVEERLLPETRDKLADASRRLAERTEYTLSTIQHALLRGGVKERLEGQHSTLFNLITQNDSLLSTSIAQDSREIAAASKRDSSSMKILAFLTTFFLPATFAATFFSMPLFDWDVSSVNDAATSHFWVYWALTGPLTVVTVIGVIVWALWNTRATRNTEKRERANFSQAIADEAQQLKRAATLRTMEVTANAPAP
ncbi:hypothetical protein BJY04DRAFT_200953 [Aspergillus karnatakaensis]|uniref:uncharacterized protein n=1 Tax=Aspergillus karnatakaensis TaxID=1810916 RepID=UPI003CCD325A